MREFTITPIKVGSILYYRGAFSSDRDEYKEKEEFPVIIFLVEDNKNKILIDTGCGNPNNIEMKESYHGPSSQSYDERPDNALKLMGVNPEEIDTVILTHLHWDHCYNNQYFQNANFYVQEKEMIASINPIPLFKTTYESFSKGVIPPWARQKTKWNIINGDYKLFDGIDLVFLPGHSDGLMGVLVNTFDGKYLLPSDAIPLYDNINGDNIVPSTLASDMNLYYKSIDKIKKLNAKIIPSHDYLTLNETIYPKGGKRR